MQESEGRSKDEIAREQLVPLREDERPLAVTISALVAGVVALANAVIAIVLAAQGKGAAAGVAAFAAIMAVVCAGLWRSSYVAVLGFQAILGIVLVFTSLRLLLSNGWADALAELAIIVAVGALFWFMVKAMARIQMPQRRSR